MDRFKSSDPSHIGIDVIEDIICRFLMHLPEDEKEFPRLFINIREACYFYADNYFAIVPEANSAFEKKFARAIFENWPFLHPKLHKFDELWIKFKKYVEKIPSFGAIILNKQLDKILFNIYFNHREDVMKMLDFPKGKANQGEDDVACAIREIKEEIDLDVAPYINAYQYISVQTLKEKYVTLYII